MKIFHQIKLALKLYNPVGSRLISFQYYILTHGHFTSDVNIDCELVVTFIY